MEFELFHNPIDAFFTERRIIKMIESFFSKMTRQMLRGIRVRSKEELEQRIYLYFEEVSAELLIFRWKYRLDEILQDEAMGCSN